ncbi:hypothetical protein CYLTODRAFT_493028 [Cylindrobasidium torrendii FP15055 ss-10]|uniref:Uncharacterized protein n=1 Tax=Cylindrobasidium torrendii FP15055 ss-10 TaxID=1314674 RepID=A0A0D7B4V3_9AGAR|nr:hypothetical protein CYLTODRAFT_493028 [Cylindrobasidium torrendii FP15055 ss-10]
MLHASARWLHDVEQVQKITLADDFNPLQERILDDLRSVSSTWFGKRMRKRVIEWNAAVNGKPEEEKTGAPNPNAPPVRQGPDPLNPEKDAPGPSTRVTKRTLAPYVDDIEGLLKKTSTEPQNSSDDEDDAPVAGPSTKKSGKRRARTPSESSGSDDFTPESPLARRKAKKMRPVDS